MAWHRVLAPGVNDPVTLSIDDKKVGGGKAGPVLLDVLGTRRYRLQTVVYTGGLLRLLGPDALLQLHIPSVEYFSDSHVHSLPHEVDYFLKRPPREITVTTLGGMDSIPHERWWLTDD